MTDIADVRADQVIEAASRMVEQRGARDAYDLARARAAQFGATPRHVEFFTEIAESILDAHAAEVLAGARYHCENDGEIYEISYADLEAANRDDAWVMGEVRKLKVGEAFNGGGGAAPDFLIRRIA